MRLDFVNQMYWDDEETTGRYDYPLSVTAGDLITKQGYEIAEGEPSGCIGQIGVFVLDLSPDSHIGPFKHALDFLIPEGTEVLAGASGLIVEVVEHNSEGGPSREFASLMNYITIEHSHAGHTEYSQYCHLGQGSTSSHGIVKGCRVVTGQPIANTGMTGWTDRPHLHFIVFRKDTPPIKDDLVEAFRKVTPGHHYLPMTPRQVLESMAPTFKSLKVKFQK